MTPHALRNNSVSLRALVTVYVYICIYVPLFTAQLYLYIRYMSYIDKEVTSLLVHLVIPVSFGGRPEKFVILPGFSPGLAAGSIK